MSESFTIRVVPVTGLSCASCAISAETTLKAQKGVTDATVNFASSTARIQYNTQQTTLEQLHDSLRKIGYGLLIVADEKAQETAAAAQEEKYKILRKKTIWALLLSAPVAVTGMFFMHAQGANYLMWALSTPVVFWLGGDFFSNAWRLAKHRLVNMDTLVALSTGVAYTFSVFNTVYPEFWYARHLHAHVYFEAAAVVIAFILLGKTLEEKAKSSTSAAIKKLMGLQPGSVTLIKEDGSYQTIEVAVVLPGDKLLARPGERIAADGVVSTGESYVDESMLTGEPLASHKTQGDKVFAGTINQKGSFTYVAQSTGQQTVLSRIIKTVQEAQGSKAHVQKTADAIAAVFVPVVMAIAVISFAAWWWLGGNNGFTYGLLNMVTVLVIACPCALGLATPTALMVGMGKAAEKGILIKDAEALEIIHRIDTLVLDKTGTITTGIPSVVNHYAAASPGVWAPALLSIEKLSEHPVAAAIVAWLENEKTKPLSVEAFETVTGKGIQARVNGVTYFTGTQAFLQENQITLPDEALSLARQWQQEAKTLVWLADGEKLLAVIAVADTIKTTSKTAIQRLQKAGIEIHLLTGDHEQAAKAVAEQTGIQHYRAGLLPEDKASIIKQLQDKGKTVAMAGDGINDSTAMATAHVSIAMGKGSDIAMDVAGITILSSDLEKIPEAIQLSKKTVRTIRQNLFWAFIYNIIGIPVAAGILYPINGFLLNPMLAGAAMALSSVSVVSNSLRLKWMK